MHAPMTSKQCVAGQTGGSAHQCPCRSSYRPAGPASACSGWPIATAADDTTDLPSSSPPRTPSQAGPCEHNFAHCRAPAGPWQAGRVARRCAAFLHELVNFKACSCLPRPLPRHFCNSRKCRVDRASLPISPRLRPSQNSWLERQEWDRTFTGRVLALVPFRTRSERSGTSMRQRSKRCTVAASRRARSDWCLRAHWR